MCIPDISNIVKYFRTCNIHEKTVRQECQWAQNKEVYFIFRYHLLIPWTPWTFQRIVLFTLGAQQGDWPRPKVLKVPWSDSNVQKFWLEGSVIGVDPEAWIQIASLLDQDIVAAQVSSQGNEAMEWHVRSCLCSLKMHGGGPLSDVSSPPLYHPAIKTSPPCSISCNLPDLNACPSCSETTHNTGHPSPISLCAPELRWLV